MTRCDLHRETADHCEMCAVGLDRLVFGEPVYDVIGFDLGLPARAVAFQVVPSEDEYEIRLRYFDYLNCIQPGRNGVFALPVD